MKIYGSLLCPDCVRCLEDLDRAGVSYEYLDFSKSLLALKEFLALRDEEEVFRPVKEAGKIGIPCIVCSDGTVTLDWEFFTK